jgi:hypothetical protein
MQRFIVVALICLFGSGCFTARIATRAPTSSVVDGRTSVSLFWGITSTEGTADECPAGLAWAQTHMPWYSPIIATVTVGIVTFIRTEWACVAATPLR